MTLSIDHHYSRFWQPIGPPRSWPRGPMKDVRPSFRVGQYRRTQDTTAFASMGLSEDGGSLEIYFIIKDHERHSDSLTELLVALAHYHLTERELTLGQTVNFGRPWVEGSMCTYGLISLPYLDGPLVENVPETSVRVLWVVPITEPERNLAASQGAEALEERLEAMEAEVMNPFRNCTLRRRIRQNEAT